MTPGPGRTGNEETWIGITESLPELFERSDEISERIWKWSDALIDSKRLRQADMINLGALLRAAYDAGKADGSE